MGGNNHDERHSQSSRHGRSGHRGYVRRWRSLRGRHQCTPQEG